MAVVVTKSTSFIPLCTGYLVEGFALLCSPIRSLLGPSATSRSVSMIQDGTGTAVDVPRDYYTLAVARNIPPNLLPRTSAWERPDWHLFESLSRHGRIMSTLLLMCDTNRVVTQVPFRVERPSVYIWSQINPFVGFSLYYLFTAPWARFDRTYGALPVRRSIILCYALDEREYDLAVRARQGPYTRRDQSTDSSGSEPP